mmetsp:Transcript_4911/g.6677  ORF Transcript_4911/g.6677 Transcript_4911/m.6677 type:complete len:210 (-) Transcript_4911:168-797(-)
MPPASISAVLPSSASSSTSASIRSNTFATSVWPNIAAYMSAERPSSSVSSTQASSFRRRLTMSIWPARVAAMSSVHPDASASSTSPSKSRTNRRTTSHSPHRAARDRMLSPCAVVAPMSAPLVARLSAASHSPRCAAISSGGRRLLSPFPLPGPVLGPSSPSSASRDIRCPTMSHSAHAEARDMAVLPAKSTSSTSASALSSKKRSIAQ